MTKEYFIELAKYNVWANEIAINWLTQIDENQWNQKLVSSFNSIALTCIHIAGAEKIWYERWINKENPIFLFNEFEGSKADLIHIWQKQSQNILSFIQNINEEDLFLCFSFNRLNGDINEMKLWQSITHCINHSSYHRGQLVTMLRQVGFTNVGTTDYLAYTRK